MFISEITKNGIEFKCHATRRETVAYILDTLGPDYTDGPDAKFWASEDGEHLMRADRMFDFSVCVHDSADAAVRSFKDYDYFSLPPVLRALADAIEAYPGDDE